MGLSVGVSTDELCLADLANRVISIFNVWTGQLDTRDECRFFSRGPDLRDIHRAHRLTQFAMWRRMLTVRYFRQRKPTGARGDDTRLNCNENFSNTVIVKADV